MQSPNLILWIWVPEDGQNPDWGLVAHVCTQVCPTPPVSAPFQDHAKPEHLGVPTPVPSPGSTAEHPKGTPGPSPSPLTQGTRAHTPHRTCTSTCMPCE